jgi:tetratricopeptide (TPR) repeat protein
MSGQTIRWAMAFAATSALSGSILLSAAKAPAPVEIERVVKRDPASVGDVELELLLNKIREGDLLSQKGDGPGAKRAWEDARRLGEGLWPIHEGLGDSYARAKRYNDALLQYQLAASIMPEKLAILRTSIAAKRAGVLAALKRPLEAIQAYLDLNQPEQFAGRIVALALDSDRAAAVGLVERHAEVYDARLFKLVAGLQAKLDRKAEAALALGKFAIRVAPWDENAVRPAVAALREARRFDAAVDVCRAWVRAVPQAVGAYQLMGEVLWDAGRERESLVAVGSMVDVRPGDPAVHRLLGEIYQRRNRPDEARAQFERGLKTSPQDQGLRLRMAEIYQARLPKLKEEGKLDEVRTTRQKLAELGVLEAGLFDIKVIMTWDVQSDVDLDIVEPDGTLINHGNKTSRRGGIYYVDNTQGLGPETYTLAKASAGKWRIGAHLHSGAKSTVKFVVILFEDTPREERREETIVLEKNGSDPTFIRDLVIP